MLKEYVLIWTLNLPPRTSNHVTVVLSHVQKKKGKTQPSRTTSDLSPSQSRTDSRSGGGRKTKTGGKARLSTTGSVSVSTHTYTHTYLQVHVNISMHTYTHAYACTQTCTHTHTHTGNIGAVQYTSSHRGRANNKPGYLLLPAHHSRPHPLRPWHLPHTG